jgi:hypothetical protein
MRSALRITPQVDVASASNEQHGVVNRLRRAARPAIENDLVQRAAGP